MIIYGSEPQLRNAIAARSQFKSHNQQKKKKAKAKNQLEKRRAGKRKLKKTKQKLRS